MQSTAAALAVVLLASSCLAAAGSDPGTLPETIIGNTLRFQDDNGSREMWVWAAPDGTYTNTVLQKDVHGKWQTETRFGVWYVKDGAYCREQQSPPPRPSKGMYCEPLSELPSPGQVTVDRTNHRRVSLMPGRQQPPPR